MAPGEGWAVLSQSSRIGLAGAAVVGVAFGVVRYVYGLTLPGIRADLGLSELVLGLVASATFAGYLAGLVLAGPLAARHGSRAPTTVGGACGALGCVVVAVAQPAWLLAVGAVVAGSAAGWVWAPYSDIVVRSVPAPRRARTLAVITTGTSGGLALLGALAVLVSAGGWRLGWVAAALAAVAAAVANVRLVPRTPPTGRRDPWRGAPAGRVLRVPAGCSVVFFAAVVVYFTYAADVLDTAGAPDGAVTVLYVVIGLSGLVALGTGGLVRRLGSRRVAGASLGAVAVALALLGVAGQSLAATALSAIVFGTGYMVGSAVLAVWTAEAVPDRAGAAFTSCLVLGALTSIAAPAVAGALIPVLGLGPLLLGAATGSLLTAAVLLLGPRRPRVSR